MPDLTLGQKQRFFLRLIAEFLEWAHRRGYEFSLGEAFRTPEQAALNAKFSKGIANSLHCDRLAIDLNLFIDGVYQTSTEAWKPLGEFWESKHPLCRWGGRFGDGNHLSLEHQGRK